MKRTIKNLEIENKRVLIRVDFNVPIQNGEIADDKRIISALPTIEYALEKNSKVILFSHLGRIKTEDDLRNNSLEVVAKRLAELLKREVKFCFTTRGEELENMVESLASGEIMLVQNTRYEDLNGKKESKNDLELAKYWASLGDIFINDAFGTAHRSHASNVGIASNIAENGIGFLVEKEVDYLETAIKEPQRPFVAVLGGAKVSDKIQVINRLLEIADKIIIGGGMAYTFYKAQGYNIGKSLCEDELVDLAKELLEKGKDKLILPVDSRATTEFSNETEMVVVDYDKVSDDLMCLDIGPKTEKLFAEILSTAKTVVWNGPMGVFEFSKYAEGTLNFCKALASLEGAITIVGGGDSASAVESIGFENYFSHVSTGGGASLEFLEGKVLPGIEVIGEIK